MESRREFQERKENLSEHDRAKLRPFIDSMGHQGEAVIMPDMIQCNVIIFDSTKLFCFSLFLAEIIHFFIERKMRENNQEREQEEDKVQGVKNVEARKVNDAPLKQEK